MHKHFLRDLPPEIRDQIYTHVLATPATGVIDLRPWTLTVEKSLALLRTCKQIHRECKNLIWHHNGMRLGDGDSQLFTRLAQLYDAESPPREVSVMMHLELLDIDELAWACESLKAILTWPPGIRLSRLRMFTQFDQPQAIGEFTSLLHIRANGELLDGRRCYLTRTRKGQHEQIALQAVWPAFSHWGKQCWFKEMLLTNADSAPLLEALRNTLCLKCKHTKTSSSLGCTGSSASRLDPRNGNLLMQLNDSDVLEMDS